MRFFKAQSGLTLIEILVAFTIMALSVALILQIIGKGNRSIVLSDEYNKASIIAESLLSTSLHPNSLESASGFQLDKFAWEYSITPYEEHTTSLDKDFQLYEINISVNWDSGDSKKRNITLSTLRLMNNESLP